MYQFYSTIDPAYDGTGIIAWYIIPAWYNVRVNSNRPTSIYSPPGLVNRILLKFPIMQVENMIKYPTRSYSNFKTHW